MSIAEVVCSRCRLAQRLSSPERAASKSNARSAAGALGRALDAAVISDAAAGGAAASRKVAAEVESLYWRAIGALTKHAPGSEALALCLAGLSAFLQDGFVCGVETGVLAAVAADDLPAAQARLEKALDVAERACLEAGVDSTELDRYSGQSVPSEGVSRGRQLARSAASQRRALVLAALAQRANADERAAVWGRAVRSQFAACRWAVGGGQTHPGLILGLVHLARLLPLAPAGELASAAGEFVRVEVGSWRPDWARSGKAAEQAACLARLRPDLVTAISPVSQVVLV